MIFIRRNIFPVFVLCITLFPNLCYAQSQSRFGIDAGYLIASTIYENDGAILGIPHHPWCDYDPRAAGELNYNPSYVVGLNGEWPFSKLGNFRGGIEYFKTSYNFDYCHFMEFSNHWLSTNYIFKLSPKTTRLNPYFLLGPRVRFALNKFYNVAQYGELEIQNFEDRINLDLVTGIGIDFNQKISFEITYTSNMYSKYRYFEPYASSDIYYSNKDRFFTFVLVYYFINKENNQPSPNTAYTQ